MASLEDLGFKEDTPNQAAQATAGDTLSQAFGAPNPALGYLPIDAGKVVSGLPNAIPATAQGFTNALGNMVNYAADIAHVPKKYRVPEANFGADMNSLSGQAGNILGSGASYLVPGKAVGAVLPRGIELASQAMPRVASALNTAKNALNSTTAGRITSNALANTPGAALFGASQSPNDRVLGAELGAGFNIGGNAAAMGARAALPAVQNGLSKAGQLLFRPKNTAEEAQSILNAVPENLRGSLPMGEVVNSAPLKNAQMMLQNAPFSGMGKPYEQLNKYITQEGKDITGSMLNGANHENLPQEVFNSIKGNYEGATKATNEAYGNFRDVARNSGVKFDRNDLLKSLNSKMNYFKERMKASPGREEEYGNLVNKLDVLKRTRLNSFEDAENFRRDLNSMTSDAFHNGDKTTYGALKEVRSDLDKTFKASAEQKPEVARALKDADDKFRRQMTFEKELTANGEESPTLFHKQWKASRGSNEPNLDRFLDAYIQKGGDKIGTLNNLMRLVPDESKGLLGAYALKKSFSGDKFSPSAMMSEYNRLGPQQQQALFGPHNQRLQNLKTISKTFPETFSSDFIPKTGIQTAREIASGGLLGGAGYLLGAGNPLGAAGMLAAPYLGRRLVTSPKLLNLVSRGTSKAAPELAPAGMKTQAAAQGIAANASQQKSKKATLADLGFVEEGNK